MNEHEGDSDAPETKRLSPNPEAIGPESIGMDEAPTTPAPEVGRHDKPELPDDAPTESFPTVSRHTAPIAPYAAAPPQDGLGDDEPTAVFGQAQAQPQEPAQPRPEGAVPASAPTPPGPPDPPDSGAPESSGSGRPWKKYGLVAGGVFAVLALGYVVDLAVSSGNMARGATVAGVDVGGESRSDAEAALHAAIDPRADHPIAVQAGDVSAEIVPADAGLAVDWDATLDRAEKQPLNPFRRVASFFTHDEVGVASTRDNQTLSRAIDGLRSQTDRATREGNIVFEGMDPVAVSPSPGQNLDGERAADALADQWVLGETVTLPVEEAPVTVKQEAVDKAMAEVAVPAASADLVVNGRDNSRAVLPRDQIGAVLSFAPDGDGGLEPRYANDAAIGILAPQLVGTEVQPKDASVELEGSAPTVIPGVVGDLVDWPKTLETLPTLLTRTHTTDAIYGPVPPALTTEDAHGLGINEVIGEFSTGDFSDASGHNIRLAASEINGAVVKPGDTFSLNGYTGTRGTAQGYVESGIINNGRPDTAVGGGVSQVATTLYNAAYFAGMEDVDHTEHSYYISRYPEAREATVFEGAIDLKFKNASKSGVMIQAIGGSSELTIRIWGTKTVDVDSITGSRSNPTQPDTVTLPAGDHCVASTGSPGFTASDTRVITDHNTGAEISRNTRTVKYDPVPTVKCVGADKPASAPKPAEEPADQAPRNETPKDDDEPTSPSAPAPTDEEDEDE